MGGEFVLKFDRYNTIDTGIQVNRSVIVALQCIAPRPRGVLGDGVAADGQTFDGHAAGFVRADLNGDVHIVRVVFLDVEQERLVRLDCIDRFGDREVEGFDVDDELAVCEARLSPLAVCKGASVVVELHILGYVFSCGS